jgi:hypothetical protein
VKTGKKRALETSSPASGDGIAADPVQDCTPLKLAQTGGDAMGDFIGSKTLDKNNSKVGSLPVQDVIWILAKCEPTALHAAVTATLVKRGDRVGSRARLIEVLEFITNIGSDDSIPFDLRVVGRLCQHLMQLNTDFGRRASSITLPCNWETSGVYSIFAAEDGGAMLKHCFRNVAAVKAGVLFSHNLFIDLNWSECRAIAKDRTSDWQQSCARFFGLDIHVVPRKSDVVVAKSLTAARVCKASWPEASAKFRSLGVSPGTLVAADGSL